MIESRSAQAQVAVLIGCNQAVQAIRDMVLNNENFDHRHWSIYDAETLERTAAAIRRGYDDDKETRP